MLTDQKRARDAKVAQDGACNPLAIANCLLAHMQTLFEQTKSFTEIREDVALRLIVHQLAYLFRTTEFDYIIPEYSKALTLVNKIAQSVEPYIDEKPANKDLTAKETD
jgi:hypothetical protein